MTQKPLVQLLDALQRDLLAARAENTPPTPWRALVARWPGVPAGTLCAISKGREPKSAAVRRALGLPVLLPAVACTCGEVHLRKGRCPNAPKRPRQPGLSKPKQRQLARLLGPPWGAR